MDVLQVHDPYGIVLTRPELADATEGAATSWVALEPQAQRQAERKPVFPAREILTGHHPFMPESKVMVFPRIRRRVPTLYISLQLFNSHRT